MSSRIWRKFIGDFGHGEWLSTWKRPVDWGTDDRSMHALPACDPHMVQLSYQPNSIILIWYPSWSCLLNGLQPVEFELVFSLESTVCVFLPLVMDVLSIHHRYIFRSRPKAKIRAAGWCLACGRHPGYCLLSLLPTWVQNVNTQDDLYHFGPSRRLKAAERSWLPSKSCNVACRYAKSAHLT